MSGDPTTDHQWLPCAYANSGAMRRLRVSMDGQVAVLAVAEKGSLEAAGKYLGIGKSGVRKRVSGVERELGTPAFRVVGNKMEPTEAGNLYLPSARESVRQAMLGVDRVRALVRVQSQDLRLGYSTYLNTKLLDIVRRIQPVGVDSITVTRESLLTHEAVAGVLHGELHVGFGILPIQEPDLQSHILMEDLLVALFASRSSPRCKVLDSTRGIGERARCVCGTKIASGQAR